MSSKKKVTKTYIASYRVSTPHKIILTNSFLKMYSISVSHKIIIQRYDQEQGKSNANKNSSMQSKNKFRVQF